jgi:hypothetical protein
VAEVFLSQEHQRLADLLDNLSLQRDPQVLGKHEKTTGMLLALLKVARLFFIDFESF